MAARLVEMWAMVWWRLVIFVCKRGAGDEVGFGEVMLAGLVGDECVSELVGLVLDVERASMLAYCSGSD